MTSVKARPASAAVKRAASQDTSLVNPLKQHEVKEQAWTKVVRPQVKELGKVSSTPPRPFSAKATVAASAKPSRPGTAVTRSGPSRPTSGTTRRSRLNSATSRQTIKTARDRPETATSRNTFQRRVSAPTQRRRTRPMSAVSLGGVSIIEEDEGEFDDEEYDDECVSVDEDDGKTLTSAAGSQATGWRHPASVLSSREGASVRRVVWCGKDKKMGNTQFCNYSKYKALTARNSGSRKISVTNVGVYESEGERRAREERESKKLWISEKSFVTDQTKERCKNTAYKTMAAWGDYKSHLHKGEWQGPFAGFRDKDDPSKFADPDGQNFQTVVYKESDARKDMAERWNQENEDLELDFQDSFSAA